MQSFEPGFIESQPITQNLLRTIRLIGEYKGKQDLFKEQSPQILETLRQAAVIQSTESSNRIEGITAPLERIKKLVAEKTTPRDRSEQEIAGYRDVLTTIHTSYPHIPFTPGVVLQLHRDLYQFTATEGGRWKSVDNEISETVERTKESYYDTLYQSSQNWHQGQHRLLPWWEYFLGVIMLSAYREFEPRVGLVSSVKGAKTAMVLDAISNIPGDFSIKDLQERCPTVGIDLIRRILRQERNLGRLACLGRGPDARWCKK